MNKIPWYKTVSKDHELKVKKLTNQGELKVKMLNQTPEISEDVDKTPIDLNVAFWFFTKSRFALKCTGQKTSLGNDCTTASLGHEDTRERAT